MTRIAQDELLELSGKIGQILLTSGAETARVESTVAYIGKAAGYSLVCHATMTAIMIVDETSHKAQLITIKDSSFNLQKVDELNHLSRQFTQGELNFWELQKETNRIAQRVIDFKWWEKLIAAGFVSVAPMLLFQASSSDLCLAFFVGLSGYVIHQVVLATSRSPYLSAGVASLLIAFLAGGLHQLGLAQSIDMIVISSLMPLVPGVAITNSFREILGRDTISGLVRAINAIYLAGAIGIGVVAGHILLSFL